jgi:hypothetical protein
MPRCYSISFRYERFTASVAVTSSSTRTRSVLKPAALRRHLAKAAREIVRLYG